MMFMAKETKASDSPASGSSAKKKPERKAPAKHAPAAPGVAQLIDPSHSAAAAAALVGRKIGPAAAGSGPKTESTSFKNLKESLNKPHIGGVLDKIAPSGGKKSGVPFGGGQQIGHNQTFGADVARRNVPRRTNG
jgi:hypothetical protein